jgi:general nucleoside transport system ATP-binding protein
MSGFEILAAELDKKFTILTLTRRSNGMDLIVKNSRLILENISKKYPGCLANDNISIRLEPGSIHAILGENGAGKSTLMKIIYGVVKPDSGTIYWQGQKTQINAPVDARKLGIGMVFQHFSLFQTLSVVENIALGLEENSSQNLDELAQRILTVSTKYGMPLEPHRLVYTLSTGERQRVEIIRCLIQDTKLLILDEPTSVLTPQEVSSLFATLRQLAAEGKSILFISHKLKEIQSLCDSATILRSGCVSGSCNPREESTKSLAKMMVGDEALITCEYSKATDSLTDSLSVQHLNLKADDIFGIDLKDISFTAKQGEILGIAGVAGNGQSELLSVLTGETEIDEVNVIVFPDSDLTHLNPIQRRSVGMCFVPEDRLGHGAVPSLSLRDNALLTGFLQGLVNRGFLNNKAIENFTRAIIDKFDVKCSGQSSLAKSLSGGNLQKFIIGREVLQSPKCLITAHPTWGVDIGAATTIHNALITLRDQGSSIIIISEDIDELFTISDRICALFDGQLSPIKPSNETTINELGGWMAGVFAS